MQPSRVELQMAGVNDEGWICSVLPKSHFTLSFLFSTWLLLIQSGGNVPVNHCLSKEEKMKC